MKGWLKVNEGLSCNDLIQWGSCVRTQSITSTWCKAGSSQQETQHLPFSKNKKIPPFTLQRHWKEAYNLSENCECGTVVISPPTWNQEGGRAEMRPSTHQRSYYWSACVPKTDMGQGDYLKLFPNSFRVAIFHPNIWLSSHSECVIIVGWAEFLSNKEIKHFFWWLFA